MKRMLLPLSLCALTMSASAQSYGLLIFTNDSTSLVTNGLTGLATLHSNDSINVTLYVGPDGVADENSLAVVVLGVPVGLPLAGWYSGGNRTVAPYTVGSYVTIQVRAYEETYGTNYATAYSAPPMNGRRALVGKSPLTRVFLATSTPGPTTPRVGHSVGPITVLPADGPPILTANDIAVSEGTNGTASATFLVRLLAPATNEVTVDYATQDGTALGGSDYVATSGTLTFASGETLKSVTVTLITHAEPQSEKTFALVLSNPVNATLQRTAATCTIVQLRIIELRVDASITFNTLSGRRYYVEKSGDGLNWTPVSGATNLLATGSSLTVVDKGSGCASSIFYRAGLLPQ